MVAAETKEDFMEPLTMIELETRTWLELVTLLNAIELELWVGEEDPQERAVGFANREKIRRALEYRGGRSRWGR
jgi:hypothetical protein